MYSKWLDLAIGNHELIAVVPIVTAAGSALLPTLVAGAATVAGLMKPRAMLELCKRRPYLPFVCLALIAAIWGAVYWVSSIRPAVGRNRGGGDVSVAATGSTDWTRVALEIIQQQKRSGMTRVATTETIAAETQPADEALIYRGGPERRGWDHGQTPKNLSLAWRYYPTWVDDDGSVVEDTDSMILSTPLGVGDRVYGASCLMDPPDTFGAVFCLDAETGEQRWITDLVADSDLKGFFSSPALSADGQSLVIGQGLHPDSQCMLVCLDAESGAVRWSVSTPLHIESSPAIEGDLVVVGCGAIENPSTHKPISHPGYVLAVDLETGKERWRYEVADPESSPVLVDGVAYIGSGFNGNAIIALRTESEDELNANNLDRLLWKVDSDYPVTGAVTAFGDTVFVGGGNGDFVYSAENPAGMAMAISKSDGTMKWNAKLPDSVLGALATDGDIVICPVANGEVHGLDAETGEARWSVSANGRSPVLAGSALADDSVYVVSKDGYLIRLAVTDGAILEKHYINNPQRPGAQGLCISSPTVATGRIYVGTETGGLRCYIGDAS